MICPRRIFAAALILLTANAIAQRKEPHPYDLKKVAWKLQYDFDHRAIQGVVTNTVTTTSPTESVWFDCGPLRVNSVQVGGKPCRFEHHGERLTVWLPQPSPAGRTYDVQIDYSGSPTAGIYFVDAEHGYPGSTHMVYTQGEAEDTRYWIPTYDFPDDKANVESFITVPAGEFALSNGKLEGIDKKSDSWTYHWKMAKPISTYLISLVAGPFSEGKESLGRLPVTWYTPPGTEAWGAAAFANTKKNIAFYNKLTGFNYPFEKFSQSAVADYMFGGMENASCVTQTIHTLHKPSNEPVANSAGLVAHELAHQWFGDTVTCADWSHAWLNEGFASFLPAFYMRELQGRDSYDIGRYDTFWGAVASQEGTHRPVVSDQYGIPMDLFDGQIYGGGAARLFTLMGQIGEKKFWAGVKAYLRKYQFQNVTTDKFFDVMSQAAGRDLENFKRQFLYTDGVPTYRVSKEGSWVFIRQKAPYFDLDLELSLLSRNDIQKRIPVKIRGAETKVDIGGYEDNLVVLDYPVTAMAKIGYTDEIKPQELLRIWWLAPNAAAKMMVLGRFGNKIDQVDMLDVAREEKSPAVLIRLLDHLTSADAVPFLVNLSRSFDRHVAYSAVSALSRFPKNQQAQDRLREVWEKDSNEYIQDAALVGLLKTATDGSLAAEAWLTESEWEMFRQDALSWWAEHDPALARQRCLDMLDEPVEPLKIAAIRNLGKLKDAPGKRDVYKALIKVAGSQSFAARSAAVDALAQYGDPAAIPTIMPMTKSSLFFLRRTGEAAIKRLQAVKKSPGLR